MLLRALKHRFSEFHALLPIIIVTSQVQDAITLVFTMKTTFQLVSLPLIFLSLMVLPE